MFLHLAKTGGTWVRLVLQQLGIPSEDLGDQHADFESSKTLLPGYKRFTIIRNPFSWYASYWAYKQYEGWKGNWIFGERCISDDFDTFIHLVTSDHPGFLMNLFSRFTRPSVTILRNELLATELCSFLLRESVSFDRQILLDTPSANPGASLPEFWGSTTYTERSIQKVIESEQELFLRYLYPTDPFMFCVRVS
jgi:hypothetical protein